QSTIGLRFGLVAQKNVQGDGSRLSALDPIDNLRQLLTGPGPLADAAQAVFVDGDDQSRAFDWNGAGKPQSEIVGGVVQLRKIGGPGKYQNRNGHETTGSYRSQERFHFLVWRVPPRIAAYYTLPPGNIIA